VAAAVLHVAYGADHGLVQPGSQCWPVNKTAKADTALDRALSAIFLTTQIA
jgi:hypothetical protein